jgi:hypothetical protein
MGASLSGQPPGCHLHSKPPSTVGCMRSCCRASAFSLRATGTPCSSIGVQAQVLAAQIRCGDVQLEHGQAGIVRPRAPSRRPVQMTDVTIWQLPAISLIDRHRTKTEIVELRGFEPLTPSMRTRCATGLRYSPKTGSQRTKPRAYNAPAYSAPAHSARARVRARGVRARTRARP